MISDLSPAQAPAPLTAQAPATASKRKVNIPPVPLALENGEFMFENIKMPAIYFDGMKYFTLINDKFTPFNETQMRRFLFKEKNISGAGGESSNADKFLALIEKERRVDLVTSLAGHKAGLVNFSGNKILVPQAPELLTPKAGDWPTIKVYLQEAFADGEHSEIQFLVAQSFHAAAVQDLYSGNPAKWRPSQALFLIGPKATGKSIFQDITRLLLGGRQANPMAFFRGADNFNSDLYSSEHLAIDDESPGKGLTREVMGNMIKQNCVSPIKRIRAMRQVGFSAQVFNRLVVSLNEAPEDLGVVPNLREGVTDKLIFLRVCRSEENSEAWGDGKFSDFWARIQSELPAYLHHLLSWKTPKSLITNKEEQIDFDRYGCPSYRNPGLVRLIESQEPQADLLPVIDLAFFATSVNGTLPDDFITGNATEILSKLSQNSETKELARRFITGGERGMGRHLGRLQRSHPQRVANHAVTKGSAWIIYRQGLAGAELDTATQAARRQILEKFKA